MVLFLGLCALRLERSRGIGLGHRVSREHSGSAPPNRHDLLTQNCTIHLAPCVAELVATASHPQNGFLLESQRGVGGLRN